MKAQASILEFLLKIPKFLEKPKYLQREVLLFSMISHFLLGLEVRMSVFKSILAALTLLKQKKTLRCLKMRHGFHQ